MSASPKVLVNSSFSAKKWSQQKNTENLSTYYKNVQKGGGASPDSHRRTGLQILGGGGRMSVRPTSTENTQELLGGPGVCSPGEILKSTVSKMPFPAFWG